MAKVRILVADDHALVRAGLRSLLAAQPDLEVVGEAADGVVVVEQCRRLAPHVVLMDLSMPGRRGISAIQDLRTACPNTQVLVVTMHEDPAYARQALRAGAAGYLLKKSLATELIKAVRLLGQGKQFVMPAVPPGSGSSSIPAPHRQNDEISAPLTEREREVASLLALGHTNVEVASLLHITAKTVETHRFHIMSKLGLRKRADLVRFALENELIGG